MQITIKIQKKESAIFTCVPLEIDPGSINPFILQTRGLYSFCIIFVGAKNHFRLGSALEQSLI